MSQPHSIIVGGTRGIGRAIVRTFVADGHTLSVIGRRSADDMEGGYWPVDLRDEAALIQALNDIVATNGPVNNLVFCQRYRDADSNWEGELQVTLTATRCAIERLTPHFASDGWRSIVALGSHLSTLVADNQPPAYHVAKAGLWQLVRYYARNLAPAGVRVNLVTPGLVLKDEARDYYRQNPSREAMLSRITPLGRMCSPQDVANAVTFLCSDRASFITGQNLVVDGGLSLEFSESLATRLAAE